MIYSKKFFLDVIDLNNLELTIMHFLMLQGPTSVHSVFSAWHQVSIRFITVENGELIAHCRNSHGEERGLLGYFKASLDIMLLELCTSGVPSYTVPTRLFKMFFCGEVRSEYEVMCFLYCLV